MIGFLKNEDFKFESAAQWVVNQNILCLLISFSYVSLIYLGQKFMKDREPLKLNRLLVLWNLALAIFSILGTLSIMPEFIATVSSLGLRDSYCKAGDFFDGNNGYWTYLFVLSKIAELGDTLFLILRKRKLIFLHWYHHVSVLIYTWHAYPVRVAAQRWGQGMNYFVHSFMYTYYLVRSLQIRTPGWIPRCITSMQISQFIIGCIITTDIAFRVNFSADCESPRLISSVQLLLYLSYLVLFGNFFYQTYLRKTSKKHVE